MIAHIYVVVDDDECRVSIPYHLKDVCKNVEGRKWDDYSKHWVWPSYKAPQVADRLRHYGCIVKVVVPQSAVTRIDAKSWAERLFKGNCDKDAYRRLTKVLHPDISGDKQLQQELNDAWRDCGCVGGAA